MTDQEQTPNSEAAVGGEEKVITDKRWKKIAIESLVLLVIFALGGGGGFWLGRRFDHMQSAAATQQAHAQAAALKSQVNPPKGYTMPAVFGDIGPQMVAAGAIDVAKMVNLYKQSGAPLSEDEMSILTKGSEDKIVINAQNAHFLLNFFWAFGLTNQNQVLTEGPMASKGIGKVGGFASTAGWTLGKKQATKLYASMPMVTLSDTQQAEMTEVAQAVYRPCCDNPTHFPDCNHGMAMLGLLELMASQGATQGQMYEAAKYVTAFWYPQQMLEVATALQAVKGTDFAAADPATVVSKPYASGSGFQSVHQWLGQNGLIEQAPSSGGSCGVR
jgi:hypothetical protein